MNVVVKPLARKDILLQMAYLSAHGGEEVGRRFIEAVEHSFRRLLEQPNAGSPKTFSNPALSGLRSWAIEGFDDVRAYYLISSDRVTILRVLHGRRDIAGVLNER